MLKPADATRTHAVAAGTGAMRRQLPHWIDHLPPCNAACPAGENIQAWLDLAQAGKYRAAWEALVRLHAALTATAGYPMGARA